jgi:hypothetical protein
MAKATGINRVALVVKKPRRSVRILRKNLGWWHSTTPPPFKFNETQQLHLTRWEDYSFPMGTSVDNGRYQRNFWRIRKNSESASPWGKVRFYRAEIFKRSCGILRKIYWNYQVPSGKLLILEDEL